MPRLQPATLNPPALVILEMLSEQPRHPYEMQQLIRSRGLDRFVKIRAGSFYHTVERLQQLGLITPVQTGRAGRRPERTIYAVTPEGREQHRDNLRTLLRHPATEYPVFGAAVEMLRCLDPLVVASMLEYRTVELESIIASFEQAQTGLTKLGHPRVHLIEIEYALAMRTAELTWVQAIIDDIRSGVLTWQSPAGQPDSNTREEPHDDPHGGTTPVQA